VPVWIDRISIPYADSEREDLVPLMVVLRVLRCYYGVILCLVQTLWSTLESDPLNLRPGEQISTTSSSPMASSQLSPASELSETLNSFFGLFAMDALKSSEALIKALKAPTDPPSGTSLLKIELAQKAWDTQSLYVPSKAELLSDWLLAKLLKEKDNERHVFVRNAK
jgi:hypothetical protein